MKILLLAIAISAAGNECCDSITHTELEKSAARVKLCEDRGGIPSTTLMWDDGGHSFSVLTFCTFPCQQPSAERK